MRKPVISALAALALVLSSCGSGESGTGGLATTTTGGQTTETVASSTTVTTAAPATTTTPATTQPSGLSVRTALLAHGFDECVSPETLFLDHVIEDSADPLFAAFDLLVSGPPGDEAREGAASWFADETAGTVRSVALDGGLLVVDFEDLRETIANASTSCGSETLLAQLNTTAFQFAAVDRVTYRIEGSCDAFFNWLQRECQEYARM